MVTEKFTKKFIALLVAAIFSSQGLLLARRVYGEADQEIERAARVEGARRQAAEEVRAEQVLIGRIDILLRGLFRRTLIPRPDDQPNNRRDRAVILLRQLFGLGLVTLTWEELVIRLDAVLAVEDYVDQVAELLVEVIGDLPEERVALEGMEDQLRALNPAPAPVPAVGVALVIGAEAREIYLELLASRDSLSDDSGSDDSGSDDSGLDTSVDGSELDNSF